MAKPQEIGRVCPILASDDASFITGQGIEADGGAAMAIDAVSMQIDALLILD